MCVNSDGSRVSHTLQNPGGNDDAMLEVDKYWVSPSPVQVLKISMYISLFRNEKEVYASEMIQNLPYFWNRKTQVVLHFSFCGKF